MAFTMQVPKLSFPMTCSESCSEWWLSCQSSALESQHQVLSFLPFYPFPDDNRTAKVNTIRLSGKNRVINEFEITRVNEPVERTLVILHGYGAGLGFFYRFARKRMYELMIEISMD
jgi:cardiolipin-specific phospholipase